MSTFKLSNKVTISSVCMVNSRCYAYATAELTRLLGRIGVKVETTSIAAGGGCFGLQLATKHPQQKAIPPSLAGLKADGFILVIKPAGIEIRSPSAKGVLNGVYELTERMGFLFLLPTEEWEWPPRSGWAGISLPCGTVRLNPRFAYRGVYGVSDHDFTLAEWLRYFAKIRFNAVGALGPEQQSLTEELGIRLEIGHHGLAGLLPRALFKKRPELFRMFQPEDFNGQRRDDSNLCAANPGTKRIIQTNYIKSLKGLKGVYAAHAWADDLPGSGWCMCSLCRSLTPSDQYLLAMRHLAEAVRKNRLPVRVPVIAYHDTVLPPTEIDVPPESFLLYAPRERCYGHALDDSACARNRVYFKAFKDWMKKFKGTTDQHTFEYYFDQVLFRGLYPFIPRVILDDMRVYQAEGIESHMSIHVWGPEIAPEFNMLVFARGHWDEKLTPEKFIADLAAQIQPANPGPWKSYLARRRSFFEDAMRFCEYPFEIYLDYRWLPETVKPFGREIAGVYDRAGAGIAAAGDRLARTAGGGASPRLRRLLQRERGRARFEAAELRVMALQQNGLNCLGRYLSRGDRSALKEGRRSLQQACTALDVARDRALAAGIPPAAGYHKSFNRCLKKEFERKARWYSKA